MRASIAGKIHVYRHKKDGGEQKCKEPLNYRQVLLRQEKFNQIVLDFLQAYESTKLDLL